MLSWRKHSKRCPVGAAGKNIAARWVRICGTTGAIIPGMGGPRAPSGRQLPPGASLPEVQQDDGLVFRQRPQPPLVSGERLAGHPKGAGELFLPQPPLSPQLPDQGGVCLQLPNGGGHERDSFPLLSASLVKLPTRVLPVPPETIGQPDGQG